MTAIIAFSMCERYSVKTNVLSISSCEMVGKNDEKSVKKRCF